MEQSKLKLSLALKYNSENKFELMNKIIGKKKVYFCAKCSEPIIENPVKVDKSIYCPKCYLDTLVDNDSVAKCPVCELINNGEDNFECIKCKKSICSVSCIKVTACQTWDCICKNCFNDKCIDGKCVECGMGAIMFTDVYFWDDEPNTCCDKC